MKTLIKDFIQGINEINIKEKQMNQKLDYESKINLIEEMKNLINDDLTIKLKKIENEYIDMSSTLRKEYKSDLNNSRIDHKRMKTKVSKIEKQVKQDFITYNPNEMIPLSKGEKERYNNLANKIDGQNEDLFNANKTADNIIKLNQNTVINLNDQGERLHGINKLITNIEENLSVTDQIIGVMSDRELFYRLKLVAMILMLFIADLIVLYVKIM